MYNYEPAVLIWDIGKKRASGDVVYWFPFIFYMEISPGKNICISMVETRRLKELSLSPRGRP